MEALKDQFFNPEFFKKLADALRAESRDFNRENFLKDVLDSYEDHELKGRLALTAHSMHNNLDAEYETQIRVINQVAPLFKGTFSGITFPTFVEFYGLEYPEVSVQALKYLTQFSSSEFAIRPFLNKYGEDLLPEIYQWSLNENHHVRRLASEGTRPKLPWAAKLKLIEENPELVKPIIFKLKKDESLYVRKSVGNHLNDLTKIDAALVLKWISDWNREDKHSRWIIERALRSLVKAGHPETISYLGYTLPELVNIDFKLNTDKVTIGDNLLIKFKADCTETSDLIIDYVVYFVGKNGLRRKVFKWKNLSAVKQINLEKKIAIKTFSTRKIYPGKHAVSVLVNGKELEKKGFLVGEG